MNYYLENNRNDRHKKFYFHVNTNDCVWTLKKLIDTDYRFEMRTITCSLIIVTMQRFVMKWVRFFNGPLDRIDRFLWSRILIDCHFELRYVIESNARQMSRMRVWNLWFNRRCSRSERGKKCLSRDKEIERGNRDARGAK